MSTISSASSWKAPISHVKSISHLPMVIIRKLTDSNKVAPLFIAPCVENEEIEDVVELACGHIFGKKDFNREKGAGFRLSGSNSLLANLSIFEATRCPICESDRLANKEVGSERDFGAAALRVAEKHRTPDKRQELYGLERQSAADDQNQEGRENWKLLEPSAGERLDMSLAKTLVGADGRA